MKIKTLSRLLAFGVLLSSVPVNSFAGVLSEDCRYETFSGNDIAINDILEEDKVDMKIEGNTLVNLFINHNRYIYNDMGYITMKTDLLQLDRTYTVFVENSPTNWCLTPSNDGNTLYIPYTTNNVHTMKFNPSTEIITMHINDGGVTNITQDQLDNIKIMILEGDWTNKEIPEYFEGIQSSFEDNLVTQEMVDSGEEKLENLGKYKVEIKSTGKNKLNIPSYVEKELKWNGYNNAVLIGYTELKPNTDYTIKTTYTKSNNESDNGGLRLCMMNDIPKQVDTWYLTQSSKYIHQAETPKQNINMSFNSGNYKYFAIYVGVATNSIYNHTAILENTQLEEGNIASLYESYKESIKTFYLNSSLLEGDTIEYINGQAYHVHNSNKVVLDGSDDEKWHDNYTNYPNCTTNRFYGPNNAYNGSSNKSGFGDDFVIADNVPWTERWSNVAKFGISRSGSTLFIYNINVNSEYELRNWLSQNPINIVYNLENPVYEPIKADLSVQLFEGTTHISNNSNIPANMEVTVDRTINRAVEAIELAKINPTISNISSARMWTNLLKETINKDSLQNEINDINNINDLQLERKTVTSNIDVYIKSENMLLMSVSTNSITFDDFSGVEDMIKENAINISINSSLPYNLNAYLATEIQNSDGTNIMDKDILAIKENSELDYQTFSGVNNKLILKENCESGNNQKHNVDLKLNGGITHEKDVYKTVIKFEVEQK